jgi:hypothetical protein
MTYVQYVIILQRENVPTTQGCRDQSKRTENGLELEHMGSKNVIGGIGKEKDKNDGAGRPWHGLINQRDSTMYISNMKTPDDRYHHAKTVPVVGFHSPSMFGDTGVCNQRLSQDRHRSLRQVDATHHLQC